MSAEVLRPDGTVVDSQTSENDGTKTVTVSGNAVISSYVLTLSCVDGACASDSADFDISYTAAPTAAPSTLAPTSAAPTYAPTSPPSVEPSEKPSFKTRVSYFVVARPANPNFVS